MCILTRATKMLLLYPTVIVSFCACFISIAEASYSKCPKVSVSVFDAELKRPGCRKRPYVRARLNRKTDALISLDAGGRKAFRNRTAFYFFEHQKPGTTTRYVSIHLAKDQRYTLAVETDGKLRFKVANPQSTMPADKFLFKRVIDPGWETIQSKLSNRFLSFAENDCSVSLSSGTNSKTPKSIHFKVKCKPDRARCYCFPNNTA